MDFRQTDIEFAAVKDFHALEEAAKRLEARLAFYTGWRRHPGGQDAYYRERAELMEIQKHIKKLKSAMEEM